MGGVLYLLFSGLYVFYLPGYLIVASGGKKFGLSAKLALGLGLSIAVVPIFAFGLAMLLKTVIQENLLFATATLINIISILKIIFNRGKRPPQAPCP